MVIILSHSPFYPQHGVQCLAQGRLSLSILRPSSSSSTKFIPLCSRYLATLDWLQETQPIFTCHHFEETKVYVRPHSSTIQHPRRYDNSELYLKLHAKTRLTTAAVHLQDGSQGPLLHTTHTLI